MGELCMTSGFHSQPAEKARAMPVSSQSKLG